MAIVLHAVTAHASPQSSPESSASGPLAIRVVVVTTFEIGNDTGDTPGEFQE